MAHMEGPDALSIGVAIRRDSLFGRETWTLASVSGVLLIGILRYEYSSHNCHTNLNDMISFL